MLRYVQPLCVALHEQQHVALSALEVAAIYKRCWEIELVFRWIKQPLRLRGRPNASVQGMMSLN